MKLFKRIDKLIEKKIGWISGTNKMLIIITIYILIGLIGGCTKEVIIERNNTIYINKTINNTITINESIYINNTMECNTSYDKDYVLSLIRQLKHYEKQQDKYFNDSDCNDDLNHTNIELDRCKQELCISWNSSWC